MLMLTHVANARIKLYCRVEIGDYDVSFHFYSSSKSAKYEKKIKIFHFGNKRALASTAVARPRGDARCEHEIEREQNLHQETTSLIHGCLLVYLRT